MSRWNDRGDVPRGSEYDARWAARADAGQSVHGEADLLTSLLAGATASVLDAGCGTGRVAIEMAARGFDVVGVDLDPGMLDTARQKAPEIEWNLGDLATVELGRTFDLVAMAGNVIVFVAPGTEGQVLSRMADHLRPGGLLVAGFQLGAGQISLADYDALAAVAGLGLVSRWSTWERSPFAGGDYAVSVHERRDTLG